MSIINDGDGGGGEWISLIFEHGGFEKKNLSAGYSLDSELGLHWQAVLLNFGLMEVKVFWAELS